MAVCIVLTTVQISQGFIQRQAGFVLEGWVINDTFVYSTVSFLSLAGICVISIKKISLEKLFNKIISKWKEYD